MIDTNHKQDDFVINTNWNTKPFMVLCFITICWIRDDFAFSTICVDFHSFQTRTAFICCLAQLSFCAHALLSDRTHVQLLIVPTYDSRMPLKPNVHHNETPNLFHWHFNDDAVATLYWHFRWHLSDVKLSLDRLMTQWWHSIDDTMMTQWWQSIDVVTVAMCCHCSILLSS